VQKLVDRRRIAAGVAYASRSFLGIIFLCGGLSKLMPFPGVIGPVWLEERLAPYELATYARFIAWSEATIGALLLTRPFATLGAIMLVPLVLNILMVTVSMRWRGTPVVLSGFLLMNLYLLAYDFHRWKSVIGMAPPPADPPSPGRRRAVAISAACVPALLVAPIIFPASPTGAYIAAGVALAVLFTEPVWHRAQLRNGRIIAAAEPR
jgi:hypothetical protein